MPFQNITDADHRVQVMRATSRCPIPETESLLSAGALLSTFAFAFAVMLTVIEHFVPAVRHNSSALRGVLLYGSAATVTAYIATPTATILPTIVLGMLAILVGWRLLPDFTSIGRFAVAAYAQMLVFGLAWGAWFVWTAAVSSTTHALLFASYALLVLMLPAAVVGKFTESEALFRRVWRRPRAPLSAAGAARRPLVSLHVPIHAEPPEVVIATLDTLAKLRYPNFEVLVIDNNTADARLWEPVRDHCFALGEQFRFFHETGMAGAKAGAVNFALRHTAADAELIGVLDSDYRTQPDFLERLVGFFEDPQLGFVQTPHDYRNWEGSLYQRMCYWEYAFGVKNLLPSLNEHGTAYTIGTMCLIRRAALDAVGGWAEWCLTEDSELTVRLYAAGYSGIYLSTTFGRGLIPETFGEYKNQRYRWACGPVQQIRHHLRLLLPELPFGVARRSALTMTQRVHELSHGLGLLNAGLGLLASVSASFLTASLLLHDELLAVPPVLVALALTVVTTGLALRWLTYRVVLGCSNGDAIGAYLAKSALSYTTAIASLAGVLNRPALWRRTNKFRALPANLAVLNCVIGELTVGIGGLLGGFAALIAFPQFGLHSVLAAGILYQSAHFLAAPVMAVLAERDIRRGHVSFPLGRVEPVAVLSSSS